MSSFYSRTHSGFAEIAGGKAPKRGEKACTNCGCGISKAKTYCGPCYDIRLTDNIARNRKRYAAKKKEAASCNS
jgi:CDGSH-type Zn-finger protein